MHSYTCCLKYLKCGVVSRAPARYFFVLIQSSFSWLVLPGCRKSAKAFRINHQCCPLSAASELTTVRYFGQSVHAPARDVMSAS